MPDDHAVDTLTFTEKDGRATLTLLAEHSSREVRDGHIDSDMEGGMQEPTDKLEQVAVWLG